MGVVDWSWRFGWRNDLKTPGYYNLAETTDAGWYLMIDFVDEVMPAYRPLLESANISHSVCMKILSDLACLAVMHFKDAMQEHEYGKHLASYLEHPEKPYENKFDFDYKAYADDIMKKRYLAKEERRIKEEEAKRNKAIRERNKAFRQKEDEERRKMVELNKKEDEERQREAKRIDAILREFIKEVGKNKPFSPQSFATEKGFDLEEVLKIVRLSESIGLTERVI